jgi:hypothetical protein
MPQWLQQAMMEAWRNRNVKYIVELNQMWNAHLEERRREANEKTVIRTTF